MSAPAEALPWWHSAACTTSDPKLFDPPNVHSARLAKSVCATCPVRRDCLLEILTEEAATKFGPWLIRGGMTPTDRKNLTPRQRTDLIRDLTHDLKENPS